MNTYNKVDNINKYEYRQKQKNDSIKKSLLLKIIHIKSKDHIPSDFYN